MTVEDIEIAVWKHFQRDVHVIVPNASWGAGVHECDLLMLSKSDYLTEVEIKVSKGDLKRDGAKGHGHNSELIKKLYFAMPQRLYLRKGEVDKGVVDLVPARAGILIVQKDALADYYYVSTVREPQSNSGARPVTEIEKFQILRLGALRIWDLKQRLQKVREAMK